MNQPYKIQQDGRVQHKDEKPDNYHCFICDLVHYTKESLWMDKNTFISLQLEPEPTSGIFHKTCLEDYFINYMPNIPDKDAQELRQHLEQRIKQMNKQAQYWAEYRRTNCPCLNPIYHDEVTHNEQHNK